MNVAKLKMKNEFLIFVLFILFVGLVECGPPQLNVLSEWVFTISGNNTNPPIGRPLEITCSGDKPVQWSTKVEAKYVEYKIGQNGSKHFSTLKIAEPIKDDTGYFNCSYVGEEDGPTKSTYVYVDDGQSGFIIDYTHPHTVTVDIGDPILLDCRTTRPDFKVTVFKNGTEILRNAYKFNPRVGVILNFPNDYIGNEIKCRNNHMSDNLSFILQPVPQKKLQKPSIENHRNSYYVVGEEFALNCSIPSDKKDNLTFKWVLPNERAKKEIMLSKDKIYAISTLKIKNPTSSDSGNYTCIVEQGDSYVSDTKNIKVKDSIDPFVQFQVKNSVTQHFFFLKEGDDFHWVLYFEGYPKNLKNTFYNPYKEAIHHKDERVSTNYVYEDGKLSLSIKGVTAEDFGNYSVRLEAPNGSYDESYALLLVNATPKIEFGDTLSLLPSGKIVSITAFILAFDINKTEPNVEWWLYTDCPEGIGSCDKRNGTMLPHTLVKDTGPRNPYKSVVTLRLSTSGELVCLVSNDFGINDTRMYLNVSDKFAPFLVNIRTENGYISLTRQGTSNTIKVIEGDDIRFECSSLDFLYDNLTFNHSVNSTFRCDSDTKLSSEWCSSITNIALGNDGSYRCSAQNRITKKVETISFRISLVEKMPPRVLPSSNVSEEGTAISVKSSDPFYIACYVEGRPKPEITWLKDGINIYEIPKYLENKDRVILKDDNQILEFKFAQKEYEGTYECNVVNRVGHIQPYANVIVEGSGCKIIKKSKTLE